MPADVSARLSTRPEQSATDPTRSAEAKPAANGGSAVVDRGDRADTVARRDATRESNVLTIGTGVGAAALGSTR